MTLGLAKAATVLAFLLASLPTSAADDQADLDKRRAAMRAHFQEEMGKLASPVEHGRSALKAMVG